MSDEASTTGPERRLTVRNPRGLHARAAAKVVRTVERFDAEVTLIKDGVSVPGDSIMGLMMLAAGPGSALLARASGADAEAALDALAEVFENDTPESG